MLQNYRTAKKIGPDKSDEYVIAHLVNANFSKKLPLNDMNMRIFLVKNGLKPKDIGDAAISELVNGFKPLNNVATAFNGLDHNYKDGDRIDRRNSGMSAIAAFFGRPSLLARATDIRFRDKSGKIVEGTFMDFGKGLAYDEGYLREVPDKDFQKLSLNQMRLNNKKNAGAENLFEMTFDYIKSRVHEARRNGVAYEAGAEKEEPKLKEIKTGTAMLREQTDIKQLTTTLYGASNLVRFPEGGKLPVKHVDDLTHGTNGSQQFADMVEAAKTLAQMQENYRKDEKAGKQLTSQEYVRQYRLMQAALKDLKDTRQSYIDRKMGQRKAESEEKLVGKNEYERNRIRYAKNVGTFLKKAEKNFEKMPKSEGPVFQRSSLMGGVIPVRDYKQQPGRFPGLLFLCCRRHPASAVRTGWRQSA